MRKVTTRDFAFTRSPRFREAVDAESNQTIDCIIYGRPGSDWGEPRSEVRFRGQTGKHLLDLSLSDFDPKRL
jgi:hypothetical protein